jgi:hypothetical protein
VVESGDAVGVQLFGSSRPVAGDQEHVTPPDPKSSVESPEQIVVDPRATAIGPEQTKLKPEARLADLRSGFVIVTGTVPAEWAGVAALIVEADTKVAEIAGVPPKSTIASGWKSVPVIVTSSPPERGPTAGSIPVTVGCGPGPRVIRKMAPPPKAPPRLVAP